METINTGVAERIQTLNPDGTRGVVLSRKHYDLMRDFIISLFESAPEVSFTELVGQVTHHNVIVPRDNAVWHLLKVKADLQARGILRVRFVGFSPKQQLLRLNRKALRNNW
jgi:hypothetical protein